MADSILFLGWGNPVRGRESQAINVFQESVEYWGRLQSEGTIEGLQVALLGPHGGDLNGFAVLQGEAEALDEVRRSEEFQVLITRANLIVDSLGVVPGVIGDELGAQLSRAQGQLNELT
jgi:hypothetical protein